jgi:hypothetical protein
MFQKSCLFSVTWIVKKKSGKPWTGAHVGFQGDGLLVQLTGEPPLVRYPRLNIRYSLSHRPHLKAVFRKPKTLNTFARGRRWTWRHNSTLGLAKLPQRGSWDFVHGAASLSDVSRQHRGVISKGQNVHYFFMDISTLEGESTSLSRHVRTTRPVTFRNTQQKSQLQDKTRG